MVMSKSLQLPKVVLFDNLQIRDTANHNPVKMLDLREAANWAFDIYNMHDQTVTLALIGSSSDEPGSAYAIGATATIAAKTRAPLVTNIWMPFLAVQVSYTASPTAGTITIIGIAQRRQAA